MREDVLAEHFQTEPDSYFKQATGVIDQGYKVMYETLIPQFEQMLAARQADAERLTGSHIVGTLLVLGLPPIWRQARISPFSTASPSFPGRRPAWCGGDRGASTRGNDELHAAADHFNEMAGAFRKPLGNIQSGVMQLRTATEQLANSQRDCRQCRNQSDARFEHGGVGRK